MQANWIGRSEGAEVLFDVLDSKTGEKTSTLKVFTTRPDTLYGATFMALAPEHPLITPDSDEYNVPVEWPESREGWRGEDAKQPIRAAIQAYVERAQQKPASDREDREKTGVFSGFYAVNPVNGSRIPVFVADYVSMDYGAGAIMAVPAHDERDYAFAQKYGLEIVEVVTDGSANGGGVLREKEPVLIPPSAEIESDFQINGLNTAEAKVKITEILEAKKRGLKTVNYKLRGGYSRDSGIGVSLFRSFRTLMGMQYRLILLFSFLKWRISGRKLLPIPIVPSSPLCIELVLNGAQLF